MDAIQHQSKEITNKYYDDRTQCLEFKDDPSLNICLEVNPMRRVYLTGAVLIRHYQRPPKTVITVDQTDLSNLANCYQTDNDGYLKYVFKYYLTSQKQSSTIQRTSFIAQFQPYAYGRSNNNHHHHHLTLNEWLPTFVVCYEIEMPMLEQQSRHETNIEMSFRSVTRQSFLCNRLDTFSRPILDPSLRRCILVVNKSQNKPDQFQLEPSLMAITGANTMDKRLFMVAKHGWLAVFTKNSDKVHILLENEYLIFDNRLRNVPIFYERIVHVNHNNKQPELFYRRTSVSHDQYSCSGMIVQRGVMQNQFQPEQFILIGLGNAIVNLTYFQQLLTISTSDVNHQHVSTNS